MKLINNIIVIGNWSAGKTQFCGKLQAMLSSEPGVKHVTYDSDRYWFEDAVRSDTEGAHSLLVADGPRGHMLFRALDGSIFNEAHRQMIAGLANIEPGIIRVIEYAIGPNGQFQEGEIFDQSSHFLVENLIQLGVAKHAALIQLKRPFKLRFEGNLLREDPVEEEAFKKYGQEGGLLIDEDAAHLGENCLRLENVGSLEGLVAHAYRDFIRPRLAIDRSPMTKEWGRGHLPETEGI